MKNEECEVQVDDFYGSENFTMFLSAYLCVKGIVIFFRHSFSQFIFCCRCFSPTPCTYYSFCFYLPLFTHALEFVMSLFFFTARAFCIQKHILIVASLPDKYETFERLMTVRKSG